ncbi:hypothetical protein EO087_14315 [Dyella sp. M7H15-1]|uniref:hypothetical protein n=1 Tax=Dyella sp. M7H15-1 TaxID=2501295 RepID=UPI001004F2F8|nr:hypothetical protein [Dyella sp. M7H15-1]QAU25023.1 hypothetical protein EO087_14315 [Dyella sp. M7H15-1]
MPSNDLALYQVAFQFQFKDTMSNQMLEIAVLDSNEFVISSEKKSQLTPYMGSSTPPMNNASIWTTGLFLNVASAAAYDSVANVVWSTFENGSLRLDLNTHGANIAASYSLLDGPGGGGQLYPGENTISINKSR